MIEAPHREEQQTAPLLERWAQALRSGEYEQSYGRMHDEDGYCCLGVANEVCFGVEWTYDHGRRYFIDDEAQLFFMDPTRSEKLGLQNRMSREEYEVWREILHRERFDFCEMVSGELSYISYSEDCFQLDITKQRLLSILNDGGIPFSVIAQLIESMEGPK